MDDEPPRPWQRLATRLLFESRWFNLRQDTVRLHTGATITYTYQELAGAVMVVPITPERRVVLLRQYRYTVGEWCWELPSGGLAAGEAPAAAAARELAEEAGYAADRLAPLGSVYPSKGVSNERLHLFLAEGVTPLAGGPRHEATELLSVHLVPLAEALAMAHRNEIRDGQAALALLLAAPHLTA